MGDDQDRAVDFFMHGLKHLDQVVKAPQINACFRFVKYGQLGASGNDHSDLDPFELATGKAGVHFTVDIIFGAQSHFRKIRTSLGYINIFSGSQGDQIPYSQSLKADRLLKSKAGSVPM